MVCESFWVLFRDPGHWLFELFLIALFDGIIGAILWPRIKRHFHRDIMDGIPHKDFGERNESR